MSPIGELDGVGEEVDQDLAQPQRVGLDRRQLSRQPGLDAQALLLGQRPDLVDDLADQLTEVDPFGGDLHLARLDLAQVEDLVDQAEERVAALVHLGHVLLLLLVE